MKEHVCPLPLSNIASFMKALGTHEWTQMTNTDDPHHKSNKFYETPITTLNKHFKEEEKLM